MKHFESLRKYFQLIVKYDLENQDQATSEWENDTLKMFQWASLIESIKDP